MPSLSLERPVARRPRRPARAGAGAGSQKSKLIICRMTKTPIIIQMAEPTRTMLPVGSVNRRPM